MRQRDHHDSEASKRKTKRNVRRIDSIVLVGIVTAIVALALYSCYAEYRRGLANTHSSPFMGDELIWMFPAALFVVAFFLYGTIRLVHGIIRLYRGLPTSTSITLNLLVAFLPLVSYVAALILCLPIEPFFMKGFERWATKNIDVVAIQQWLATDGAAYAGRSYEQDSFSDLPPCLTQPHPWKISLNDAETDGYLRVELFWGGKIAMRSVVVGPPTMSPDSIPDVEHRDGSLEHRFAIGPGAYAAYRW